MKKQKRNDALVDWWSVVHFVSSAILAWLIGPLPALLLATLWEPLEILLLSPLLARKGIPFGHEAWQNSLSDLVFNSAGIVAFGVCSKLI